MGGGGRGEKYTRKGESTAQSRANLFSATFGQFFLAPLYVCKLFVFPNPYLFFQKKTLRGKERKGREGEGAKDILALRGEQIKKERTKKDEYWKRGFGGYISA